MEFTPKTLKGVKGNSCSSRLGDRHVVVVTAENKKAPAFFAEAF
jgi:hypothetical protein